MDIPRSIEDITPEWLNEALRISGFLGTYWADTGHEDVLRDFRRSHRDLDNFPGPLGPSPSQARTTIGTGFQDMFHPVGRRHALAGKPMGTGLS